MHKASSVTVVVPALNEENNLGSTIATIKEVTPHYFEGFEILVFNDGSTDATGCLADRLAQRDPRVRVVHHREPRNLGGCYREGIERARKEFLILVPGDNECGEEVLHPVFSAAGRADMIVPYTDN